MRGPNPSRPSTTDEAFTQVVLKRVSPEKNLAKSLGLTLSAGSPNASREASNIVFSPPGRRYSADAVTSVDTRTLKAIHLMIIEADYSAP